MLACQKLRRRKRSDHHPCVVDFFLPIIQLCLVKPRRHFFPSKWRTISRMLPMMIMFIASLVIKRLRSLADVDLNLP